MKYLVTLHGKNYEVEVDKGEAIMVAVTDAAPPAAPAAPAAPVAAAPAPAAAPAAPAAPVVAGGTRVDSPLPGTVTDIKVAVGDTVKKGDLVFIIEAMKMENEIVSPADGKVAAINCAKGDTVSTGDLLMTLIGG